MRTILYFCIIIFLYILQHCCWCLVAKSCLTHCNPVDCSPPGPSVHGISQARILEWVAISFFTGSSQSNLLLGGWILYYWVTWEAPSFEDTELNTTQQTHLQKLIVHKFLARNIEVSPLNIFPIYASKS